MILFCFFKHVLTCAHMYMEWRVSFMVWGLKEVIHLEQYSHKKKIHSVLWPVVSNLPVIHISLSSGLGKFILSTCTYLTCMLLEVQCVQILLSFKMVIGNKTLICLNWFSTNQNINFASEYINFKYYKINKCF